MSKEVKDQLSSLQSRLEAANTGQTDLFFSMNNIVLVHSDIAAKTNRIDELEGEISHLKEALQNYQDERVKREKNRK